MALLIAALEGCILFSDPSAAEAPVCASDLECDDGIFCNGAERCAPGDAAADLLGCAPGELASPLDDGLACTQDRCDEARGIVIHDPTGCACVGDLDCAAPSACQTARCDEATRTCVTTQDEEGTPCDDGVDCTVGTTCDSGGRCVVGPAGARDDARCSTGFFCVVEERCAPEAQDADPQTGCTPGQARALPEAPPACAMVVCDEESATLRVVPTAACACQDAASCQTAPCEAWRCDASTGFTCVREEAAGGLLPAGTACDDGLTCTVEDQCDEAGGCAGAPASQLCLESCERGAPECAPAEADASAETGCRCP